MPDQKCKGCKGKYLKGFKSNLHSNIVTNFMLKKGNSGPVANRSSLIVAPPITIGPPHPSLQKIQR